VRHVEKLSMTLLFLELGLLLGENAQAARGLARQLSARTMSLENWQVEVAVSETESLDEGRRKLVVRLLEAVNVAAGPAADLLKRIELSPRVSLRVGMVVALA
jgi:hypothetical protein